MCVYVCVLYIYIYTFVYTYAYIVVSRVLQATTTWTSSGIRKHKHVEMVIRILVRINFFHSSFLFEISCISGLMGNLFPTEIRHAGTLKRWVDSLALLCCSPMQFFNRQPYRLTLWSENLDKSLFVIAFLQAKWLFHLHLCNCISQLAAGGRTSWKRLLVDKVYLIMNQ